jgi:phosphomethylpyrimidine synthase
MKITQDVRDYAAQIGVSETEVLERGMEEKAEELFFETADPREVKQRLHA